MARCKTQDKMLNFFSQTCIRTCFSSKNELGKNDCRTIVSLVDLRSHVQQRFLGYDQHCATNLLERTVGAKISRNEVGLRASKSSQRVYWFGSWRKTGSSESFHRNFPISRKFHISSHPSGNNSKKIGEWVCSF